MAGSFYHKGRKIWRTIHLTQNKKQAIEHFEEPAMVLAGPGSGKTTVITNRVLNLIEEQGVSPKQILVVTFQKPPQWRCSSGFAVWQKKHIRCGLEPFILFFSDAEGGL